MGMAPASWWQYEEHIVEINLAWQADRKAHESAFLL